MNTIKIKKRTVKNFIKFFLKLSLYLIFLLIISETVLRVGGLFYRDDTEIRFRDRDKGNDHLILAIGDSYTYGVHIKSRNESYPAQLEHILNSEGDPSKYKLINEGIPGINSRLISNYLDKYIHEYDPDKIILLVGSNNIWNTADENLAGLLYRSKVYVLYKLLKHRISLLEPGNWRSLLDMKIKQEQKYFVSIPLPAREEKEIRRAQERLEKDLVELIEKSKKYDKDLILLTYPWCITEWDSVIRKVSAEKSVDLIDICKTFYGLDPRREIYSFEEGHPNEKGNRLMAETIAKRLIG